MAYIFANKALCNTKPIKPRLFASCGSPGYAQLVKTPEPHRSLQVPAPEPKKEVTETQKPNFYLLTLLRNPVPPPLKQLNNGLPVPIASGITVILRVSFQAVKA